MISYIQLDCIVGADIAVNIFETDNFVLIAGLEIRGILVANATMFCHLLPGFSCGSKHLLLP